MRKLLAFPFALAATVCWFIADFLWDVRQPRHEYNVSELSPEARRVIAALEALQQAEKPKRQPVEDEDTQPYYPARLHDLMDFTSGDEYRNEGFDTGRDD